MTHDEKINLLGGELLSTTNKGKYTLKAQQNANWRKSGLSDLNYTIVRELGYNNFNKSTKITVDIQLNHRHWRDSISNLQAQNVTSFWGDLVESLWSYHYNGLQKDQSFRT
jgi:hypothetical protein